MDTKDAKDTAFSVLEGSWMELDISSEFKSVYHADHVRRHSKILGWMMNDSPCETWARGLAAAFQGHAPAHVELFIALSSTEEENMNDKCSKLFESRVRNSWEDVAGVVSLADKLNAPLIMEACENFIIEYRMVGAGGLVGTLNTASRLGLEKARQTCLTDLLSCMMAPDVGQQLETLPGRTSQSEWEDMKGSDARLLLQALMRSRHELSRSFEDVVVSYVRDEYCKSKAQERFRKATSLSAEKIKHYLR